MDNWRIDPGKLHAKIEEISGHPLKPDEGELSLRIAQRVGRESGDQFSVSTARLAKVRWHALSNPLFLLNATDRRLTALTLEALYHLLHPVPPREEDSAIIASRKWIERLEEAQQASLKAEVAWRDYRADIGNGSKADGTVIDQTHPLLQDAREKQEEAELRWHDFLSLLTYDGKSSDAALLEGGARLAGLVRGIGYDFLIGAVTMRIGIGHTVDMRFAALLKNAIQIFERMKGPSRSREESVIRLYQAKGLPAPEPRILVEMAVYELKERLENRGTDQELLQVMESNHIVRGDVEDLFRFIAVFHKGPIARAASDALIAIAAKLYGKRADALLGKTVDGHGKFTDPRDRGIGLRAVPNPKVPAGPSAMVSPPSGSVMTADLPSPIPQDTRQASQTLHIGDAVAPKNGPQIVYRRIGNTVVEERIVPSKPAVNQGLQNRRASRRRSFRTVNPRRRGLARAVLAKRSKRISSRLVRARTYRLAR